jgi:predicted secreted protein
MLVKRLCVFITVTLLITFPVSSCAKGQNPNREIKESSMEIPTKIEIKVGETYRLRLPSLGTAGYVWTYGIQGNRNLVDVSEARTDEVQPIDERGTPLVGASVDKVFKVQALEPGSVTIHFTQSRPWEKDKAPLKEHYLEIFIQG